MLPPLSFERAPFRSLDSHLACTRQNHPRFDSYPLNVQLVATDMTFNMGCEKAKWPIFIRQLEVRARVLLAEGVAFSGQKLEPVIFSYFFSRFSAHSCAQCVAFSRVAFLEPSFIFSSFLCNE
jgi:hypothetical protein